MGLPNLGRAGIRESVRKITAMKVTGHRKVDSSATFYGGMVAKLATVSGKTVVTNVTGITDAPIGIFYCNKTDNFYRPIFKERHVFGEYTDATGTNYPNVVVIKPYLLSGSVSVYDSDGTTLLTVTTDYTVDLTLGTITRVDGGAISSGEACYVSARYRDINLSGIDDTMGSGKVALIEDTGEIATLVYDTTAAWTLGASVRFTTAGLLTIAGSGTIVGTVTKVPTAEDAELCFKCTIG